MEIPVNKNSNKTAFKIVFIHDKLFLKQLKKDNIKKKVGHYILHTLV